MEAAWTRCGYCGEFCTRLKNAWQPEFRLTKKSFWPRARLRTAVNVAGCRPDPRVAPHDYRAPIRVEREPPSVPGVILEMAIFAPEALDAVVESNVTLSELEKS